MGPVPFFAIRLRDKVIQMPKSKRPVVLPIFGGVNIAIGFLMLVCGICGLGVGTTSKLEVNGRDVTPDYKAHMRNKVPLYDIESYGNVGMTFLMGIAFVGSGIAMFLTTRVGHALAVLTAVVSGIHQLVAAVWQVAFLGPAKKEFMDSLPFLKMGFLSDMETIFVCGFAALIILYDLGLLLAMLLPGTFRAVWSPDPEPPQPKRDDRDFEEDDDMGERVRRKSRGD
jgi:hypothetical protein